MRLSLRWAAVLIMMVPNAGCRRPKASNAGTEQIYSSIAEARTHLPANCALLFIVDGIPQSDSMTAIRLLPDDVKAVRLVAGTERGRCPAISIETRK